MKLQDIPPELAPFAADWLLWRPDCDGWHTVYGCCWCATRCHPLTDADFAAGLARTVMGGTIAELEAALVEQARREQARTL